jgi:hypothetical protein
MMISGREEKGSKHQLQEYVNSHAGCLNIAITEKTGLKNIQWISPLKKDDYAELFDLTFRSFIDNRFFKIDWEKFWPMRGGPRWDGIAVADDNTLLLVEAKSYPKEALGNGSRAKSINSINLIEKALQDYTGNVNLINSPYYQFANRVAFTNFLNEERIKTTLLILNFYEDTSHTNSNCLVSQNDFICQSKLMLSEIDIKYQSHVSCIYIKALN